MTTDQTDEAAALEQEGKAYIKRREDELYSAVTEKARQEILILQLTRSGADEETIKAVIAAKAQIERDIPIIGRDLSLSAQSANLSTFLQRMEAQGKQILNEIGGLKNGQSALQAEFHTVGENVDGLRLDVGDLRQTVDQLGKDGHARDAQIRSLSDDMAIVKAIIEARPAQRKREAAQFEERQAAIEARQAQLEAQLREMRGEYTPEQRQRYITVFMEMMAEWEAAHPVSGDGDR